jgi:hypothetical protein
MRSKSIANFYLPMALIVLTMALAFPAAAQQVNMTFSGTSGTSATNLQQPNTSSGEDDYAGTGTLGSFTFRLLEADTNSPMPSDTCAGPNEIYLELSAGGGAFRFQDGSLLYVQLTHGSDCINLAAGPAGEAHCIRTLQISGGTGRFKNVSGGTLTLTETVVPVLADALGNPVFFAATGKITGTVAGATDWQGQGGGQ